MRNGTFAWPHSDSSVLVGMVVVRDGDTVEIAMEVTFEDLESICARHNLDLKIIHTAIIWMTPEQHTIMIDAEKHRQSLRSYQ